MSYNSLDHSIIVDIMAYIYKDKKNAEQISRFLNKRLLVIQYYLLYLLEQKIINYIDVYTYDTTERYYYLLTGNHEANINVSDLSAHMLYAKEMAQNLEDALLALKSNDIYNVVYTIVEISEDDAADITQQITAFHKEIETRENSVNEDKKKYMLLSAFTHNNRE